MPVVQLANLKRYLPLAIGLVSTALVMAWTVVMSVRASDGWFVYGLDDAYIHMTMARTFALHGVWGINPDRFVSASSSPLWVLILAAIDRVAGVHELTSFMLNVIFSALLLWLVFKLAVQARMNSVWTAGLLFSVGVLAPLSVLVMNGMEHLLQALLDLAFIASAIAVLSGSGSHRSRTAMWLLSAAVTAVRYEGAVLVGIVSLLLAVRGRWRDALVVGVVGAFPIVVLGTISMAHGGYVLPSSVLLKTHYYGSLSDLRGGAGVWKIVARVPRMLWLVPSLAVLAAGSLLVLAGAFRAGERWTPRVMWNAIFVAALLLHLQFAAVGFFRYEAYLIVLGLVAIAVTTVPIHTPGVVLVAAACALPIAWRAFEATATTPTAVANIYQQQYQMGLFVRQCCAAETVAVNDIGAVSYLGGGRVLDLVGLADIETAKVRMADRLDADFLDQRTRREGVRLAIVYEGFFNGFPPTWQKVGEWKIPNRVSAAYDSVSFFAVQPSGAERLAEDLRSFSGRLPSEVEQRGLYTQVDPHVVFRR